MIKINSVITHLQNKFIECAIEKLSRNMPCNKLSLFVCDIHHFLLALTRGDINSRSKNVVLVYNNDLEVFILQSICDVSFVALDVRTQDVFDYFQGCKVFKKVKPFKQKEDNARMRVFLLILRGWDDDRICQTLLITMKKLREYKSQLTYTFFEKRRNLFYLTLNGFLQRDVLAA
ncbi:hypothetical protein [Pantoea sp. At-9b]|uniref:hypothetical protein n=1 Tax=Pantoea sp. (strain At-9b) TaxID=592316 RepID=UPI0001B3F7D1|nr:hypothetical protein [Pantoea sp. At-9b]ADU72297.1 hypothetical protein Pat9b_5001 [Pantoea sp. At-9b]